METPDRLPVLATDPPLTDEELDRVAVADPQDVDYQPWSIDGVRTADWAMRKVAEAQAYIDDAHDAARAWHAEIDEWFRRTTNRAASTLVFLGHHLEQYALDERERTGSKTLYLPGGEVRTTIGSQPKVVVVDEAKLIEWCEATYVDSSDIVKVEKHVLVSELRKHVEIKGDDVIDPLTGELVPGVDVMPAGPTTVKVVPR